jgi:uncharacterized protein YndB with AHSA1/START domain
MKKSAKFGVMQIRLEVRLAAPRRRVWTAWTRDIGRWWPEGFVTQRSSTRFVLEPRLGGRAYESGPGGQGLLWWTVTGIETGKRLQLAGDLTPSFGGPARIFEDFVFEDDGKGTLLKFTETVHGFLGKDLEKSLRSGWAVIFDKGLRPWVEKRR